MPGHTGIADYLDALGTSAPTPGGGSASALAAALAAALAEMVAQLTIGRPRYQEAEEAMRGVVTQAQAVRAELLALMHDDEQAYLGVAAAYKLPRATEEEQAVRAAAIQAALAGAMKPPMRIMARACDALDLAGEVAASGNASVVSDAGCAALLGEAAVRAAGLNVLANVVLLRDEGQASEVRADVTRLEERAEALRERTMAAVHSRMGL
jgi:formiminotetrahydrofolate cyclodeaminase